ncbi:AraC family transcriptional regulator [Pseudoxanthomonas wuyuanensis]|uniref:Transcriptional regulator, AraC family n=1 Tax=Pseudoxanthomonas wuyuanensis TaxID=1073196 RepID=A0A286DEZ9_9GAMM|nr:AraC family transcriptional regulator [Pseudoxanthomonas wuyuanensis]KAF1719571.1 AraC family transcriptional regulator [Pseudoxanthomonas wuyuanensis]SOD57357.1 transcriptional regulator, AraC family [Pseudoxanthomonas wuyuanensis]
MLAHSSRPSPAAEPPSGPDLLTQVLLGLRLDGVEYGRCLMHAPWAIDFPTQPEANFHFVANGGCWLRTPGSDWLRLNPGDAVLLPRGGSHTLASDPDVPAVDIDSLAREPVSESIYLVRGEPDETDAARPADAGPSVMFCGTMRFNLDPLHPLLAMMPEVMRADDLARRDPSVPALLEAMEREVAFDRIGACGILARLADVLAASIIRAWVECGCSDSSGWIAALHCPRIGKVIAAIHADPQRDWSVPALADVMGASRSSFAEAFTRTVGESPAKYVAKVKMFQARRWIAQDGMRVAVAADRLGYDSEASFSRAFKRIMGTPPSAVRSSAP